MGNYSDMRPLLGVSRAVLSSMYRDGISYKRVGVMLLDLVPADAYQTDLLTEPKTRASDLMSTLDAINTRFGRGSLGFAAQGWRKSTAWRRVRNISRAVSQRDGLTSRELADSPVEKLRADPLPTMCYLCIRRHFLDCIRACRPQGTSLFPPLVPVDAVRFRLGRGRSPHDRCSRARAVDAGGRCGRRGVTGR